MIPRTSRLQVPLRLQIEILESASLSASSKEIQDQQKSLHGKRHHQCHKKAQIAVGAKEDAGDRLQVETVGLDAQETFELELEAAQPERRPCG